MDLKQKSLYLLDMDGTIYLGDEPLEGAHDFLSALRRKGCDYVFLTNNSSRGVQSYVDKLCRLGFPATSDNLFTSGQAAAMYLARLKPGAKVYYVGTRSSRKDMRGYGLRLTNKPDDDVDFLLVGYDTELTYAKLEDACELLCRGVPFYATNPDHVCPIAGGRYLPDCYTICQMLTEATGKEPFYIGKPRPEFALEALRLKKKTASDAVIVGDRIYTDIACGVNANIFSVMVLSGESTRADIDRYGITPDLVVDGVKDLLPLL